MEKLSDKNGERMNALFYLITGQLKSSVSAWEDFANKATKLQSCLRSTVIAASSFLEAFQNMADLASNTQGTRDIGISLTRLCLRHRSIHIKMKNLTNSMVSMLVTPITEKLDEWKKMVSQLEKDHNRDMKKAQGEVKKSMSTFARLQKKAKKDNKEENLKQLDDTRAEFQHRLDNLEKVANAGVKNAMIEEKKRYATFVQIIRPFVDEEISMLGDVTHLQEIMDVLVKQSSAPITFPEEFFFDRELFPLQRNFTSPSPTRAHPKLHSSFSLTNDLQPVAKVQTRHHENCASEANVSLASTNPDEQTTKETDNSILTNHCSRTHRCQSEQLTIRMRPHSMATMHNGLRAHNAALVMQRSETCDGSSCRFEKNVLIGESMTRSLCLEDNSDIFSTQFDNMISVLNSLDKDATEAKDFNGVHTEQSGSFSKESSYHRYFIANSEDVTPTNENQDRNFAEQFLSQLHKESYVQNTEVVDNIEVVLENEGINKTMLSQSQPRKESTI